VNLISPINGLFAGLIGIIVVLYILRLKRKEYVVSSTLLWQSALRDLQANAPWQKLRSSLLMWLQIAFLAIAVLALMRPAIKVLASGGQTVAIIIDASGSMAATDVKPSRFENARGEAGRLINALSSGDTATIIAAGARTKVLAPLTTNKNILKRALGNARTQDTSCNLREAIVLANSLLRGKRNAQVYVLSDGAVAPITDLSMGNIALQFVRVGQGNDNLGITAMDVRRGYGGGNAEIFVTVRNFSKRERTINLELLRDGELVKVRPMTIKAGAQESELFDDTDFQSGLFSVRFESGDALASDDVAYASLDASRTIRALLISDGNIFLEKALTVDPNVELKRTSAADFATAKAGGNFDVVICDGIAPPGLPDANQLVFNVVTDLSPVTKVGVAPQPGVADFDRRHPATRFAPWNDVRFAQSMAVQLKPWGQAVVEGERSPLVVAGERAGKRIIWCGFSLRETDLPFRVAFPIFITSSMRWLSAPRGTGNTDGAPRRASETVALAVPSTAKEVTVTRPDRSSRSIPVSISPVLYSDADRVGVYKATAQAGQTEWQQQFGVSLLNKTESDLTPRDALQIGSGKPIGGESRARANKELWGYLALFGLLLLGVEWWVYHRGV